MDLTVSQLKNKFRNLSTVGNKAELVLRMNIEDPQDTWMNEEITRGNVHFLFFYENYGTGKAILQLWTWNSGIPYLFKIQNSHWLERVKIHSS